MEAGAKPRHLRGDDGGLGGSSTGQGCGGGRQEAETEAFPGVTGPRIGQRGPDHRRSVRFLFARPPIVRQFSRLLGWATCFWAAAAASLSRRRRGLKKGRGEVRLAIPLRPVPPAPGRRDPCHSADAAILLLRLQPTQNAPSPREPLLHSAEHSGKGISGASPKGSAARERAEPDP